jgi:hypothetical protein
MAASRYPPGRHGVNSPRTDHAAQSLNEGQRAGRVRAVAFRVVVGFLSLLFGLGFVALTVLTLAVWAQDPLSSETNPVLDIGFFGLGGVIVGVGFLAQLRVPHRHLAGLQQSLIGLLSLSAAGLLGQRVEPLWAGGFAVLVTVVAIALHPARDSMFRRVGRASPLLASLAAMAAVPALVYADRMLALARDAGPSCFAGQCAAGDRLAEMAALVVAIVLVTLLASTRPRGWRISAWSAGVAALLFGLAAVALPNATGSPGLLPAAVVVGWAVALLAATEWEARRVDARAPTPHAVQGLGA